MGSLLSIPLFNDLLRRLMMQEDYCLEHYSKFSLW
jgi:hypothetical protein